MAHQHLQRSIWRSLRSLKTFACSWVRQAPKGAVNWKLFCPVSFPVGV